jgi:hypothetical protein
MPVSLVIFVSCRQKFQRKRLAIAFDNADPRAIIIAIEARFGQGLRVTQANEKGAARIALSLLMIPLPAGKGTFHNEDRSSRYGWCSLARRLG